MPFANLVITVVSGSLFGLAVIGTWLVFSLIFEQVETLFNQGLEFLKIKTLPSIPWKLILAPILILFAMYDLSTMPLSPDPQLNVLCGSCTVVVALAGILYVLLHLKTKTAEKTSGEI